METQHKNNQATDTSISGTKNTKLFISVVFIILLLAGGYYIYSNKQNKKMLTEENTIQTQTDSQNTTNESNNEWAEYTPDTNEKMALVKSSRTYINGMLSGDPVQVKATLVIMTKASLNFMTPEEKEKATKEDQQVMTADEALEYANMVKPIIKKDALDKLSDSYFISGIEKVVFYKKGSQWGTKIDVSADQNTIADSVWIVYTKDANNVFNVMHFQTN